MQPKVMTRYHLKVIWITLAAVALIGLAMYEYGKQVPALNESKQNDLCVGAKNTLADLEKNPSKAGASDSKIVDARQLAETECAKTD